MINKGGVMKRFTLCFIAVLLFFSMGVTCYASSMSYVGNKSTKVYHISKCTYAGKISTKNCRYFSSRSEAEAKGYHRCYYCGDGVVEEGNGGGSSSGGSSSGSSDTEKTSQTSGKVEDKESEKKTIGDTIVEISSILLLCTPICLYVFLLITFFAGKVAKWKKNRDIAKAQTPSKTPHLKEDSPLDTLIEPQKSGVKSVELVTPAGISMVKFQDGALYITFTSGAKRAYFNVPEDVIEGLLMAKDKDRFYFDKIYEKYPFGIVHH